MDARDRAESSARDIQVDARDRAESSARDTQASARETQVDAHERYTVATPPLPPKPSKDTKIALRHSQKK